jgi:hypothetical protein
MKINPCVKLVLASGLALSAHNNLLAADHAHLNAGAVGVEQNDKLIFNNAANYLMSSGYVKTLTHTNAGTYAGYYQGNVTLTALPQTAINAGPVPNAPAPGSFIRAQLVSVEGPADGVFAFWDSEATSPTISLVSGQTGTNSWVLSENDGSPGSDPYGHIHGRRFTATKPGIYTIGFRRIDGSTNGIGGGPIHTPSDVLKVYFQADVNMQFVEPDKDHSRVHFSAPLGSNWQLETTDSLEGKPAWVLVGTPITGDDLFHEMEHNVPVQGQRYYRIRAVTP